MAHSMVSPWLSAQSPYFLNPQHNRTQAHQCRFNISRVNHKISKAVQPKWNLRNRTSAVTRAAAGNKETTTELKTPTQKLALRAPPDTLFNANLTQLLARQLPIGVFFLLCNQPQAEQLLKQWNGEYGLGMASLGLLLAGIPLALFGEWLQRQSNPVVNTINQETKLLTMRVFGTQKQPLEVGLVAGALSLWVAVTEELCYRGAILPSLADRFHSVPLALLASSVIFGAAHWGGDRTKEGGLLVLMQTFYGLMFGGVCLLTGGSLVAPVAAHFAYDFWTFVGTHLLISGQVEYSKTGMLMKDNLEDMNVASKVAKLTREHKLEEPFVNLTRFMFYWIDSNKNGFLDVEELRVGLCAFGKDPSREYAMEALRSVDQDYTGMLDFGEFLQLVVDTDADVETAVQRMVYSG